MRVGGYRVGKRKFLRFLKNEVPTSFWCLKKTFWVSSWRRNFPQKNVGKHFFITSNNYTLLQKDQGKRMQVSSFFKVIRCVWVAIESEKKFYVFWKMKLPTSFWCLKKNILKFPMTMKFPSQKCKETLFHYFQQL